ncbi:hypothetical protein A3C57_01800 [Candidatus Nomurabacteria bacterium RIFCSPHIGHO2_02_FULL_33_12]|uniref:HEPN domain-containing protein n=1 Tax=Candidatus Nomurabacteria bacterium RIFCSPLOWO2_01_FULL_33_17 TaxID=1801764 RepID=A0A1F6WP09_9BACT|nr:MAG: hypothetical protein A3C57_01800 [Candidatus Nomurabacteria bacterium RIFCSPHIGHO2_02_FULL_33_12]OGI83629.1 MAG: hypothetical protein A2903_02475 [Candidatus Nomurabacteria bacterium RIFCSPLOWO2_01_FULL_33_17]
MSKKKILDFWLNSSKDDFKVVSNLFQGKHYSQALFFCHLSLEKYLKYLIEKNSKESAPFTHNLIQLAELTGINFNKEHISLLSDINNFNIRARYDDFKRSFYKKATLDFTKKYIKITETLILWLEKQSQNQ